jgi:hypothetical protein
VCRQQVSGMHGAGLTLNNHACFNGKTIGLAAAADKSTCSLLE